VDGGGRSRSMPATAMVASVMDERGNAAATADREAERAAMVERQLMARGVRDLAVLAAMRSVPREIFVPDGLAEARDCRRRSRRGSRSG
jgi:hypothetical protein